jgi:hypothetical protein
MKLENISQVVVSSGLISSESARSFLFLAKGDIHCASPVSGNSVPHICEQLLAIEPLEPKHVGSPP